MSVDDVGRLWVGRTRVEGMGPAFDVFSADCPYQGSVELGFDLPPYMPTWVRGGRISTVVGDSLDVPFLVRTHMLFETP